MGEVEKPFLRGKGLFLLIAPEFQSETLLYPSSIDSAPDFPSLGRDFLARKSLINSPVADWKPFKGKSRVESSCPHCIKGWGDG
jgi:hypothetical protein